FRECAQIFFIHTFSPMKRLLRYMTSASIAASLSYQMPSNTLPPAGRASTIHAHFHERVNSDIRPLSPNQKRRTRKIVRSRMLRGKTCDALAIRAPSITGAASVIKNVHMPSAMMKVTAPCSVMLSFRLQGLDHYRRAFEVCGFQS